MGGIERRCYGGLGTLWSFREQGKKAMWKSCEQIRMGSRKGTEEGKQWRIRNGGAHGETLG